MPFVRKLRVVLIVLLVLVYGCATSPYPVSDHFDGKRFFNPGAPAGKSFTDFLKWQWTRQRSPWPEWRELQPRPTLTEYRPGEEISIEFVNHATFLIRTGNLNILTDPIYSDRASPVSFAGPKRVAPPGIPFDEMILALKGGTSGRRQRVFQVVKFKPLFLCWLHRDDA